MRVDDTEPTDSNTTTTQGSACAVEPIPREP